MIKEKRNLNTSDTSVSEGRHITGYALVYDSESNDLGGFTEVIDKRALEGVIEKSDVMCVLNHNPERGLLARSKQGVGSLTLTVDERGLKYEFEAPNTALGDEVLEGIKRGDISASSFVFTTKEDKWEKRSDGSYLRTILQIEELFDVSPVYTPAYDATSVDARGLDNLKAKEKAEYLQEYFNNKKSKLKAYDVY